MLDLFVGKDRIRLLSLGQKRHFCQVNLKGNNNHRDTLDYFNGADIEIMSRFNTQKRVDAGFSS